MKTTSRRQFLKLGRIDRQHCSAPKNSMGHSRVRADTFFNKRSHPLAEGRNVLPGEHAYSHVNAFSSAMQAYLTLGERNIFARPVMVFEWFRSKATRPVDGVRMNPLLSLDKPCWKQVWKEHTPASRRLVALMATSKLHVIYCELPATLVTATAWNACFTTLLPARLRFLRMEPASSIPTTTTPPRRSIIGTSGPAAQVPFRN